MKNLKKSLILLTFGGAVTACSHSMPMNLADSADQIQGPTLTRYYSPAFPEKAARNCEAGSVLVQYDISDEGHVKDSSIRVLADAGSPALAEAAVAALDHWRYDTDGIAQRSGMQTAFNFEIEGCKPE